MTGMGKRFLCLLAAVAVVQCSVAVVAASDGFDADVMHLTRHPHRLTGSPAAREAAVHLAERLRSIGLEVIEHPFDYVQTRVLRCEVELQPGGSTLPLHPMRPNGIIPPVSPPGGIRGPLMQLGRATSADFDGRSPEGAIAVMDYNSEDGWLRAFRMGAQAVIFTGGQEHEARFRHSIEADANLPRFYYDGSPEDLPDGIMAVLHSAIGWQTVRGHNVYGLLRGSDPVFDLEHEELVVLAARLDTYGEVPTLSPGARGAANCAGLLLMARHMADHRPRRNTLFAFVDGEARGHAGSSELYRALESAHQFATPAARLDSVRHETAMLELLRTALAQQAPLESDEAVRRELQTRLRAKAETRAFASKDRLFVLRDTLRALDASEAPEGSMTVDELGAALTDGQVEQEYWNDLRRYLVSLDPPPEGMILENLMLILDEVREDVRVRMDELARERESFEAALRLHEAIGSQWISLHISLLFGDARSRWGLVIGGDSDWRSDHDMSGLYGRVQSSFMTAYTRCLEAGRAPVGFETRSADGSLNPTRLLWAPRFLVHGGEIAGRYGLFNLVLGTVQDPMAREGTPSDTRDLLAAGNIAEQARQAAVLVAEAASGSGLSLRRAISPSRAYMMTECTAAGRLAGPAVMSRSSGSSVPNRRTPEAVIRLMNKPRPDGWQAAVRKFPAFDNFQLLQSNRNGNYSYGPVSPDPFSNTVNAFAAVFDARGVPVLVSTLDSQQRVSQRLNMFPCRGGVTVLTPQFSPGATRIMRAAGNAALSADRYFGKTIDGVTFWYAEDKIDAVKLFGLNSVVMLNSGPDRLQQDALAADAEGEGMALGAGGMPLPAASARSAADLWRLNEARMAVLRTRGVNNASVEELHGRAQDLMLDADALSASSARESMAASSFLLQRRVYNSVRGTLNDLVRAVLILLLLSVPFAFALERLLIGATTIYKRLLGFVAFFLLTFLILFFTHPAFAIAATPIIIFLGFAIVVLSSLVIIVIMNKFELELKILQGAASTVHAADVSRLSTVLAAMNMGISTMRRRPLRTALTAVTIILLTFTILCFASFGTRTGIVRMYTGVPPGYAGVYVHDIQWAALSASVRQTVESRWGDQATVARRIWLSPTEGGADGLLVTRADGTHPTAMQGVLGLDAAELRHRPDLATLLPNSDAGLEDRVWITSGAAELLGVAVGETICAGGLMLTLAGFLDASAMVTAADMDGSGILPVDFRSVSGVSAVGAARQLPAEALLDSPDWAYLPVDSVLVVAADNAVRMGAQLRALTLYTGEQAEALDIAEEAARMMPMPVAVTTPEGVYRFVLGNVVQASGVRDLFFPILLGGLVVFGTMLGSVADREREIYTFSALGLAPPHVASLFFSEAMVFSVIGGMGGYLLAQGSMKLMEFLASFGLVTVPELNYSSMNAIVTILIVMATVMVSALYPALRASRSANPGLLRSWKLPPPDGDTLSLVFPFTVSAYDITGVVSFLREHFSNYSDSGMGSFMARNTALVKPPGSEGGTICLEAELALAPFDLGVTQSFRLQSSPSEIPGINEVFITLQRISGQPKDWHRLNKVLLDDLRKQFLIWRALPQETMESYRQRTLQSAGYGEAAATGTQVTDRG